MSTFAGAAAARSRSIPHWLAHHKPVQVVGIDAKGVAHEIAISESMTAKKWAIAWRTLQDVGAVTARALDANGKIIATTAIRYPEEDEPDDTTATDDDDDEPRAHAAPASPATAAGYDVTAVVQCVAREVRQATREGANEMREAFSDVLTAMTEVIKLATERLASVETTMHEMQMQQIEEREARSQEDTETRELVHLVASKMLGEGGAAKILGLGQKPNGAPPGTNGVSKPAPTSSTPSGTPANGGG